MPHRTRRFLVNWLASLALGSLAALAPAAPAAADGELTLDVDLQALLTSPHIFPDSVADQIWDLKPTIPGRRLVQVPFFVEPGREATEFTMSSPVRLNGGRLLAWRLNDVPDVVVDAYAGDPDLMGDPDVMVDVWIPTPRLAPGQVSADEWPHLTRRVSIEPGGIMRWRLERVLPGADLKGGDPVPLYVLKINRELLNAKAPAPPPRPQRGAGQDQRTFIYEQQRADAEYRAQAVAFRELLQQVNNAPDEFSKPLPPRIWAVFEVSPTVRTLALSAPGFDTWEISFAQLEELRQGIEPVHALGPDERFRLSPHQFAQVQTLSAVAMGPHRYNKRIVAYALWSSGLVQYMQRNDVLYNLVRQLIASDDSKTHQAVMNLLTKPPTPTSLTLLPEVTAKITNPAQKVRMLENVLQAANLLDNPNQATEMVATVNRLLAEPRGPAPADVLANVLRAANQQPVAVPAFMHGVQFMALTPERFDQCLAFILEHAGDEPLAAYWLDQKLLGAADPAIVSRCLEAINTADTGGRSLTPLVNHGLDRLFGQPQRQGDSKKLVVRLPKPIPVESVHHSLFRVLQHGDSRIRAQAWQALPNFTMPDLEEVMLPGDPGIPGAPGVPGAPTAPDRYQALLETALRQPNTPRQVVAFLSQQPDTYRAGDAMVQIVLRGSTEASARAAQTLRGSQWPLDRIIAERLSWGERQGFAERVYDNLTGQVPLVTGLLRFRDDHHRLAGWFGTQLAQGNLPDPSQWRSGFGSEDELLALVSSNDLPLARGAVAALVNAAGGRDSDALVVVQFLRSLPDQTPDNIKNMWRTQARILYARKLQRATGPYRLVLRVFDQSLPDDGLDQPGAAQRPSQELVLGIVQLQADGHNISFGNQTVTLSVPDSHVAIRVEKPGELKNFQNEELAKLPLETLITPLDLLPQADGSWVGRLPLDDGRTAEVLMQPVTAGAAARRG